VHQVSAGDPAKARAVTRAGEQLTVDVGEGSGPDADIGFVLLSEMSVHRPEAFGDDLVNVATVGVADLFDSPGKEVVAIKDAGILSEEAEDQPGHEVVHFRAAFGGGPVRVVAQQFEVELVEAAGGLDVEGALADLLDGADAGQLEEEVKCSSRSAKVQARVSPLRRFSASRFSPSVARMNLAFCLVVSGASESFCRVSVTCPDSQTARWMLLRWRMPPDTCDLLELPLRRRLMVVSLLP
jgi:hypothetical protein